MSMKNHFEEFWKDKSDPLHRSVSKDHMQDYGDELKLLFRRSNPQSVLDLGCGTGSLFLPLEFDKVQTYKGVDFSQSMLDVFSKDYPGTDLECADASSFNDGQKYDLVFSNSVVQNFDHQMLKDHITNAKDMLNDGGALIVASVPWSALKFAYLKGEAGPDPINSSTVKGVGRLIKHGGRSFGRWMSNEYIAGLAKEHGMDTEFFGSVYYPYRFHARMKRSVQS